MFIVLCAVACILLAAAPTATPCFRRWRRSSPLPLVGEPLAKPFTLRGLPKPPLGRGGGSASALTERLSPAAAHGQASLHTTSQSHFVRQGRVAAPSVCCAVACILLAAAPTAPPCFRHWRRSSPLPLVGEPLAKPFTLRGLPKPPLGRGGGSASALTERLSPAAAHGQASILSFPYKHN